jgi:hypothetical protein
MIAADRPIGATESLRIGSVALTGLFDGGWPKTQGVALGYRLAPLQGLDRGAIPQREVRVIGVGDASYKFEGFAKSELLLTPPAAPAEIRRPNLTRGRDYEPTYEAAATPATGHSTAVR